MSRERERGVEGDRKGLSVMTKRKKRVRDVRKMILRYEIG